jgi:hypothetical protein
MLVGWLIKECFAQISLAALAIEGDGTNYVVKPIFVGGMVSVNFITVEKGTELLAPFNEVAQR